MNTNAFEGTYLGSFRPSGTVYNWLKIQLDDGYVMMVNGLETDLDPPDPVVGSRVQIQAKAFLFEEVGSITYYVMSAL